MFKALIIRKKDDGTQVVKVENLQYDDLPNNDVLVDIEYSTLNYKDCLAITNKSPIIRNFPFVPGIDFSGKVAETKSNRFNVGDRVVLNGYGVGEKYWGGLSQKARVKEDWLTKLPNNISNLNAMAIGTAGYTAMLAVMEIERKKYKKDTGEVIVTGVGGGVGGISVSLLSALGYNVVGATSRMENSDYILKLGAKRVISYDELLESDRPLDKEKWLAGIDVLGGKVLERIYASVKYNGILAVTGLAADINFNSTVFPLILRGVTVIGIDSVYRSQEEREDAWNKLSENLNFNHLDNMKKIISFDGIIETAKLIMEKKVTGRVIVDINK